MKLNQFAPLKLQDILVKVMLHETVFPHEIYFATLATAELVAVDMPLHAATDCFRSVTKSKTIQLFFASCEGNHFMFIQDLWESTNFVSSKYD